MHTTNLELMFLNIWETCHTVSSFLFAGNVLANSSIRFIEEAERLEYTATTGKQQGVSLMHFLKLTLASLVVLLYLFVSSTSSVCGVGFSKKFSNVT